MSIVIWISLGIFLLIPYYLRIFLLNSKKTKEHILFWITLHFMMLIVHFVLYNQVFSLATVLLIGYSTYFLFSYLFYVKDSGVEDNSIRIAVNSTYFEPFKKTVIMIASIMLVVDFVFICYRLKDFKMFEKIYLIGVIIISYYQCNMYLQEYQKCFKE